MREAGAGARETELCSLRFGKTLEGLGIQTCGLCAEGGREEERGRNRGGLDGREKGRKEGSSPSRIF